MSSIKRHMGVVIIACTLASIGLLAGLCEAILMWKRDGNPVALLFWIFIVGGGGYVLKPMIQYAFHLFTEEK